MDKTQLQDDLKKAIDKRVEEIALELGKTPEELLEKAFDFLRGERNFDNSGPK